MTDTANEVPVPEGMTLETFTQLVVAKQAVAGFLDPHEDPSVLAALETATDAWFTAQGPYMVQQLLAQTVAGTVVGDRVRAYFLTFPADHQVCEVVTEAQEVAATQAVTNGIAAVVAPEAPVPETPAPVVDLPFNVNATHHFDSFPVGSTATKVDENTLLTQHGSTGIESQHPIGADDAVNHVPVGTEVAKTADGTAITLPANAHRSTITSIGNTLHSALASVWHFVVHEEEALVAWVKSEV
jgi:hypothetical protein